MRNLALIIILLFSFAKIAFACNDTDFFQDKCACTGDETPDNGVMPCLRNRVDDLSKALGTKDHGPYKRHFFIHRNECLGALGVNALPHPKNDDDWPEYHRSDSNTRKYKNKKQGLVIGECKSGLSTFPMERMMVTREANATIDNVTYRVQSNWCWGRRYWIWEGDQYEGLCSNIGDDDDPDENWGNSYTATFQQNDVTTLNDSGATIKLLKGSSGSGHFVNLIKIYPNEEYAGVENNTNLTKICGFLRATAAYVRPADGLFGCVDEPPLPGPDVYNKTLKSTLSPRVDTNICMDASQTGKECDRGKRTMIERGSTFDKPMVVITGNIANEDNILELRYQFEGDFDPNVTTCAPFIAPGFQRIEYCAQINPTNPGEVCACIKGNSNPRPNNTITNSDLYDNTNHNYCGKNPLIQCVPRPTLEHSSLKLIPEYVAIPDVKRGRSIPSVKPVFVETRGQGGEVAYIDKQNREVCVGGDNKYYVCDESMKPTNQLAENPIRYKRKLALPRDGFSIKEYYLQETIVNDNGVVEDAFKGTNCVDSNNSPVYFDYDQKFYKIINGKLNNNQPAVGNVKCNMPTPRVIIASDLPTTVLQDTKNYIYGLNLSTMIPEIKDDNTIRFERFAGPFDYSLSVKECIPYTLTELCDSKGRTVFFPAGTRDRTLCGTLPPISQSACTIYNMGDHDPDALKARCPGIFKDHYGTGVNSICLRADADWTYDTIENYNKSLAYRSPIVSGSDCREPISTDLCVAIGSTCEAVTSRNNATGLTLWPEMNNNETITSTCDPTKGLVNTNVLSLGLPTKVDYCGKISKTGAECDTAYVAYIGDDGDWIKLAQDIDNLQKSTWEQGRNITNADVQGVTSQYNQITQDLFTNYSSYKWEDPKRTCMNRSSTYEYPCKVVDSCNTINQATAATGYATWLGDPDAELALSTSEKKPDAVVNKIVTGRCSLGKVPAPNTTGPTRTCKLTLNEKGDLAFGTWSGALKDPCVDPPPPPPTGTTGDPTSTPGIVTCPAITNSDPATGFATWSALSMNTNIAGTSVQATVTGTCIAPKVPAANTQGPTLTCKANLNSNGEAVSASWGSLTNPCVGAYTPPVPVNNCNAITQASSVTGYATFPKANLSITGDQKIPNETIYKTVYGNCVSPRITIAKNIQPTLSCKITLDEQGNVVKGAWVTTLKSSTLSGTGFNAKIVVDSEYAVKNACISPAVSFMCINKSPWECCGGKDMIFNGYKNDKGKLYEICSGSDRINNPKGSKTAFSCSTPNKPNCNYVTKTGDGVTSLYNCSCIK